MNTFWKFHLGLDGFLSSLFFVAEILPSNFGIQPKTNFNNFYEKNWEKLNSFLIKGRHGIIQIRMLYSNDQCHICMMDHFLILNLNLITLKHILVFRVEFLFPLYFYLIPLYLSSELYSNESSSPSWVTILLSFFLFLLTHLGCLVFVQRRYGFRFIYIYILSGNFITTLFLSCIYR